jgi:hypothetical protein
MGTTGIGFAGPRFAQRREGSKVAFIVLGGAHDLSPSIRRVAGGRCEYVRVTTSRAKRLLEEGR